jgi:transcriptional regulator with XRE-family HTH domain
MHAAQLRAARALLKWDQTKLANEAGVSVETIKRLEKLDGPLTARADTLERIQRTLEAHGVVFVDRPHIGVSLHVASAVPSIYRGRRVVLVHTSPDEPVVAITPEDAIREAAAIKEEGNRGWAQALRDAAEKAKAMPLDAAEHDAPEPKP